MKALFASVVIVLALAISSTVYALYAISESGDWDKSWPAELEPLRKQARTLVGPMVANRHYAIRFNDREQFEAAWPHLLKIKTAGSPIYLQRGESFFLGEKVTAGVVVHCPPDGQSQNLETKEKPIEGVKEAHTRWMNTTTIALVVDGDIVDLNRIPLPADTPIVDERFEEK
jgi:hypothetical protein